MTVHLQSMQKNIEKQDDLLPFCEFLLLFSLLLFAMASNPRAMASTLVAMA